MLWDTSLFPKLPKNLLASVHREVCRIRSSGWGSPSGNRARIYERGWNALCDYHKKLIEEMKLRGWKVNHSWEGRTFRGRKNPPIDDTFMSDFLPDSPLYTEFEVEEQTAALKNWEKKHDRKR